MRGRVEIHQPRDLPEEEALRRQGFHAGWGKLGSFQVMATSSDGHTGNQRGYHLTQGNQLRVVLLNYETHDFCAGDDLSDEESKACEAKNPLDKVDYEIFASDPIPVDRFLACLEKSSDREAAQCALLARQ